MMIVLPSMVFLLFLETLLSLCSAGSLGKDGVYETLEEVHVKSCTLNGTTNGARIKTWEGNYRERARN